MTNVMEISVLERPQGSPMWRDERSMLVLEVFVSVVALVAAGLLGVLR